MTRFVAAGGAAAASDAPPPLHLDSASASSASPAPASASISSPAASYTDTVIVGTGPSALILSFILHGNIPYYDLDHPHPDPILHKKLSAAPCLLQLDVPELTAHFDASRISYSTQALPVNTLLDTLLRPLSDVEPGEYPPSLVWRHEPGRAVDHVLIGDAPQAGGQWANNLIDASWDRGALSYIEQLCLPKYTILDHLDASPGALSLGVERPTRRQVTDYLAEYPAAVGIQDAIRFGTVDGVSRTGNGFHISSHNLACKHLVLASGTFTKLLPPPAQLQPLAELRPNTANSTKPLLVIGSGFSAADVIISGIQKRRIIHIFHWQPENRPSPLQACHPQAYPDYAGVYRQMKQAASKQYPEDELASPPLRKHKPFFDEAVWTQNYVGLPNAEVEKVEKIEPDGDTAQLHLNLPNGERVTHQVSALAYVTGRRGSLDFLDDALQGEVLAHPGSTITTKQLAHQSPLISGNTLREKTELDVEIAPDVFAIGSLTGDSLIRFSHGGCVQAAGKILGESGTVPAAPEKVPSVNGSEVVVKRDGKMNGTVLPVNGGHEDLGRAPVSPSRLRLAWWTRRKSSCVVA